MNFLYQHPYLSILSLLLLYLIVRSIVSIYKEKSKAMQSIYSKQSALDSEMAAFKKKETEQLAEIDTMRKELQQRANSVDVKARDIEYQRFALERREKHLNDEVLQEVADKISKGVAKGFLADSDVFRAMHSSDVLQNERFYAAFTSPMRFEGSPSASCQIHGSGDNVYTVTLNSCTCEDYKYRHTPCKHMFRLGLELGMLHVLNSDDIEARIQAMRSEQIGLQSAQKRLSEESNKLETQKITFQKRVEDETDRLLKESDRQTEFIRNVINTSFNPAWLSSLYADYTCATDEGRVNYLRTKRPAAPMKADEIEKDYKQSKREWVRRAKAAEYQLQLYEAQFPDLEDFKEISLEDIPDESISFNETDPALSWLSNEEYVSLPRVAKFQLALDRYQLRSKSKWEIGIDFERYTGYQYYKNGYRVEQHGAIHGLEDLGRDLVVHNGNNTVIIQCKRWKTEKTIHEKHIFQLYGSVVSYQLENPKKKVSGLFICTCSISETAKRFADYLGVQYEENAVIGDYPLIKCNINRTTKERIYHLPFDQQYDRVVISPNSEECYAWTVQEAEDKGFRRAWRWHSQQGAEL